MDFNGTLVGSVSNSIQCNQILWISITFSKTECQSFSIKQIVMDFNRRSMKGISNGTEFQWILMDLDGRLIRVIFNSFQSDRILEIPIIISTSKSYNDTQSKKL